MKKIFLLLPLAALSMSAFAEPQSVECGSNPGFGTNTCEVCYTDNFEATEGPEGWVSNISTVKIPWKHNGGDLDEIIYDNEQKFPEIKTALKFSTKPEKPKDLWTNHESLIWTPFSDHKEVFIQKDTEIGLYKLQDKAGITVHGKKPDDTLMFVTPLVVRDFDSKTNEDSDPVTRNICVLGKFTIKKGAIPTPPPAPIVNPPVVEETVTTETALESAPEIETQTATTETTETTTETTTTENPGPLDAAAPEETVATAEQTKTPTGPAFWISLLLAFALASAWSAWKKQKA